jgi:hypothetical protein
MLQRYSFRVTLAIILTWERGIIRWNVLYLCSIIFVLCASVIRCFPRFTSEEFTGEIRQNNQESKKAADFENFNMLVA